jgi:hypothetical protein
MTSKEAANKMAEDKIKLIKQVWKAVFKKEPMCAVEDTNPITIRVNDFALIAMEGDITYKTIRGEDHRKAMGWAADVFVSTYSYQDGPDGDTVDLGWERNFGDALQLIIAANARDIAENILQSESLAEGFAEDKKFAEMAKEKR